MAARVSKMFAAILCLLIASACSDRETSLESEVTESQIADYAVVITALPEAPMQELAKKSLQTYLQRDRGVPSLAFLRRRAESDLDTLRRLLASRGYLNAKIAVDVVEAVDGDEPTPATVTFEVDPGAVFQLTAHRVQLFDPAPGTPDLRPKRFGSPVGKPAVASEIVSAEQAMVADLKARGYAYATALDRKAEAVRSDATLSVETTISAGRTYRFGQVQFDGVTSVDRDYLLSYVPWTDGAPYDAALLRSFQVRLSQTELFTAVTAAIPETAPIGDTLPITVRAEERKPRTVTASLRYDTVDGPEIAGSLTHRNLLGENERGTLSAEAGLRRQAINVSFVKPQYLQPGQRLLSDLEVRRVRDDAFDELGGTLFAGLERDVPDFWTIGAGGFVEISRVRDAGVSRDVKLAGLPVFASFDNRDDPLDPTRGRFFRVKVTPVGGLIDLSSVGFLIFDAETSAYVRLDEAGRTVLAGRARFANIVADQLSTVPAQRRLYSGGGGSVRGFARDLVGPRDALNDPTGGLSAIELGAELRTRIWGDIGGVAFVDAGAVSPDMFLADAPVMRFGAGIGVRYYSPVGPIRLDVATPINPQSGDDLLQFYLSIGQAF